MKILFLRVGIDRGCGGRLSPLLPSGEFEYIPIPESTERVDPERGVKYSAITARKGGTLEKFVTNHQYAHYDPEFVTPSYGEPSEPKRSQLLKLDNGDRLVFYAGFSGDSISPGTCFVIGFFTVKTVHKVFEWNEWPPKKFSHLWDNAHFKRKTEKSSLVVVEGYKEKSFLFDKALALSDSEQKVLPDVSPVIGFSGSVKRAIGRWVPPTHVDYVRVWLDAEI